MPYQMIEHTVASHQLLCWLDEGDDRRDVRPVSMPLPCAIGDQLPPIADQPYSVTDYVLFYGAKIRIIFDISKFLAENFMCFNDFF